MSRRQCCVWGCSNRKGRCPEDVSGKRLCECSALTATDCPKSKDLLSLHTIEVMPDAVKKTVVKQINLTRSGERGKTWTPTAGSVICNIHYKDFVGPSRADPNRIPVLFKRPTSHDLDVTTPPPKVRRVLQKVTMQEKVLQPIETEEDWNVSEDTFQATLQIPESDKKTEDMQKQIEALQRTVAQLTQDIHSLRSTRQRLNVTLLDGNAMHFYTGLSHAQFSTLLEWLVPVLPETAGTSKEPIGLTRYCHLSNSQRLLLTLMRIRCGFLQEDLGIRFLVDQSTVSRTLSQWIPLLARQLEALIQWPKTTIGPTEYPYSMMPNTVGIIDRTEIFIERPSNLSTQKSSWSDYKSHSTVKYLVSIDPFTGVFTYISAGFSGNASDRFIVENSTFLDNLLPGQRILADRGFTICDLLAKQRAFLTIPSFLRSSAKLSGQDGSQTRAIATVRIKVENAIKRLKDFKIFQQTQPNRTNKLVLDDMVIIACSLCNLQAPLIKS